jgi:hypothetical protein
VCKRTHVELGVLQMGSGSVILPSGLYCIESLIDDGYCSPCQVCLTTRNIPLLFT